MDTKTEIKSTGVTIIKRKYTQSALDLTSNSNSNLTLTLTLPLNEDKALKEKSAEDDDLDDLNIFNVHTELHSSVNLNTTTDDKISQSQTQSQDQSMVLSAEQKEELIEKLETKKYNLKVSYKQDKTKEIVLQYKEVCSLLAKIKECDAQDKIKDNIHDGNVITLNFRKKFKELAVTDFNRIIDLTGSKDGRKPDIATEAWIRGRTVVFKDKVYRPPPDEKLQKFRQKMELKPMPSDIKKTLQFKLDGNLEAVHIHTNESDNIKYKKYDPLNYKGLNIY